jgi:uncharacterized damage-inducible protein DinB
VCLLVRLSQRGANRIVKELKMKIVWSLLLCLFCLAFNHGALAQDKLTVSDALDFWISHTEKEVTSAAAAMPEEKYSFAPVAGEFNGVRTFAQQVKHLAATNYRLAAYILIQKPTPEQESEIGPDSIRSKAQILDYLAGSFAELHRAVASVNEGNAVATIPGTARQHTRLQFAIDAVAHSYDHYGQMVEYLRMSGIVPPASRR